jgi:hypothetical protein
VQLLEIAVIEKPADPVRSGSGLRSPGRAGACVGPVLLHELTFALVLSDALGSAACFQGHRRPLVANLSPPKRSVKAAASAGSAKQNTTKSLSSRRMEYVSSAADRAAAAQNITSLLFCGRERYVIRPCA